MELKQVDMKTSFLHRTSEEVIYMQLPPLLVDIISSMKLKHVDKDEGVRMLCKVRDRDDSKIVLKLDKST